MGNNRHPEEFVNHLQQPGVTRTVSSRRSVGGILSIVDSAAVLGIVAVVVSVLALCVSALLGARQTRLMWDANHVPAVIELLSEFRSKQFHDDYQYIITRLRSEHDPELGISGLPESARAAVLNVAYYFQVFAFLIGFEIVDEAKVMSVVRLRVIQTWEALEPYVLVERKSNCFLPVLTMLETLAHRARHMPVSSPRELMRFDRKNSIMRAASLAHARQLRRVRAQQAESSSRDGYEGSRNSG